MHLLRSLRLSQQIALLVICVVISSLLITGFFFSRYISEVIFDYLGGNIMNVARIVAREPVVVQALSQGNKDGVQGMAEELRRTTGVTYIVVFDRQHVRLSHPNPAVIGQTIVGGDEGPALAGKEYISRAEGTLGPSLRAFTPVRDARGQVVGAVVVGILADRVSDAIAAGQKMLAGVMVFGLIIGCAGAYYLSRNIKKVLFGLEPPEIAKILEERNAILQGTKEGVIAINSEGVITLINEAGRRLLHMDQDGVDYVGSLAKEVVPNTRLHEVLQTGQPEYNQIQEVAGTAIMTNRLPIRVHGKIAGVVATFRDMTEFKALAEELADVKTYSEALRSQSHEFMNKLHVIWGLIKLQCYGEASNYIASVVQAAETEVAYIVQRIKHPVVAGLLIAKFSKAREMGATLTITADSALGADVFMHDRDMVTILGNLIDNAIEAVQGQQEKKITVAIRDSDEQIDIIVTDTGPGIIPEYEDRLFTAGFSTKGNGRGIGLVLVQQAVRTYGGAVTVHNMGTGCRFVATCYHPRGDDAHDSAHQSMHS